jgi:hypothetical protein
VIGRLGIPPIDAAAQPGHWIEWAAGRLGLEAEPVEFPLLELDRGLMQACPQVLALPDAGEPRFLLLLKAKGRSVALNGPDLRLQRHPVAAIWQLPPPGSTRR